MMDRKEYDKAFFAKLQEEERDALQRTINAYIIMGHVTFLQASYDALFAGMELSALIEHLGVVIDTELETGVIDEATFKIPEDLNDTNDGA
jgi:hypothetical protein